MSEAKSTKIIIYDGAEQKRRMREKAPWISVVPRIGHGWTYWVAEYSKFGNKWLIQSHSKPVVYHDQESGVVVTEDTVYVKG